MNTQQHFLKFEAVLAHCEQRLTEPSLQAAMKYGRAMEFLTAATNSRNRVSFWLRYCCRNMPNLVTTSDWSFLSGGLLLR